MTATVKPTRHVLRNAHGWTLIYETFDNGPDWNTVRVIRKWRGEESSELCLTRDQAREHYAAQQRAGFISPKIQW